MDLEHIPFIPTTYSKSNLPIRKLGNCEIKHFVVEPLPLSMKPEEVPDWARRRPGRYTVLIIDGVRMMTDLYEEWWSQRLPIEKALELGGHVFISGLGLGLIINSILSPARSIVQKVTVIEKNPHVIELVGSEMIKRFTGRLEIICNDVLEYVPKESDYTVVWHDIWPNPTIIPQEQIDLLRLKFEGKCQWQGIWTSGCYD